MKIKIKLPDQNEALAGIYSIPDQLAGRLSQQTEPSDEEILEAEKRKKEEELEEKKEAKDKDTKKTKDEKASDDDSDDGDDSDSDDDGDDSDSDGGDGEADEGDSEGDSDSDDGEADEGDEGADSDPEESVEGDAEEPAEGDDSEGESEDDDSESTEEGDEVDAEDSESDEGEAPEEDEEAVASTGRRRIYRGQAASKQCVIVCGFPGVGKSTLAQTLDGHYRVVDCDSSQFSEDETFPRNYVDHIQQIRESGEHDICFISTHDAVRLELKRRGIPYVLVYPVRASKVEYLSRYLKRGSSAAFVETLEDRWDAFIDSCEEDDAPRIILKPQEYVSDVISALTDQL